MTRKEFSTLTDRLLALPRAEQAALVEALQTNLAPIPDWHREILDARVAAADADPDSFVSAPEVVERVRAKLRRH